MPSVAGRYAQWCATFYRYHGSDHRVIYDWCRRRDYGRASLSFLGLGVPLTFLLGEYDQCEGQQYFLTAPELALWPGFALSIVVFGINMFGDGLRDLLDPRLRGGVGRYTMKPKHVGETESIG